MMSPTSTLSWINLFTVRYREPYDWEDLSTFLLGLGFTRNPYDWCVTNKEVMGTQQTILFYVDDIKMSHVKE